MSEREPSASDARDARDARDALDALLRDKRLLVCVGPGGVGKTTVAAALALEAARAGRRALVLTIDPARRLADALGLDGLDDGVCRVDTSQVTGAASGARGLSGELSAAMLETSASYDALVRRITDPAHAARILDNRVYRAFSRTLARSHAYVALERLYDVERSGDYDIVVLDTPPLRSALDILDAPDRLMRFLDADVVRFFLDRVPSSDAAAERGMRDAATTRATPSAKSKAALSLLSVVVGRALIAEMVAFLSLFASLRDGFAERAAATTARLRRDDAAFVLVASAGSAALQDARFLRDGLRERGLAPGAVILNRAYLPEPHDPGQPVTARRPNLARDFANDGSSPEERAVLDVLTGLRARAAERNAAGAARGRALVAPLAPTTLHALLPTLDAPPQDLAALLALGALLRARLRRHDDDV